MSLSCVCVWCRGIDRHPTHRGEQRGPGRACIMGHARHHGHGRRADESDVRLDRRRLPRLAARIDRSIQGDGINRSIGGMPCSTQTKATTPRSRSSRASKGTTRNGLGRSIERVRAKRGGPDGAGTSESARAKQSRAAAGEAAGGRRAGGTEERKQAQQQQPATTDQSRIVWRAVRRWFNWTLPTCLGRDSQQSKEASAD